MCNFIYYLHGNKRVPMQNKNCEHSENEDIQNGVWNTEEFMRKYLIIQQ